MNTNGSKLRRTRILVGVLTAMALVVASCSLFDSREITTTTTATTSVASSATSQPETTQTTGSTGSTEPEQPNSVLAGNEPPPGVEDQFAISIAAMMTCAASLHGPGPSGGTFELLPAVVARLVLGELVYADLAEALVVDPDVLGELERLPPMVIRPPEVSPRITIHTLPTGPISPPLQTLPTIASPTATLLPNPTFTTVTVSPDLAFTTITRPTDVTFTTVTLPPDVDIPTVTVPPVEDVAVVSQASEIIFCGWGWGSSVFVQVVTTGPEGVIDTQYLQTSEEGHLGLVWRPGLNDPVGTYTISATDGSYTVEDTFELVPPDYPTVDILGVEEGAPGDSFMIGMAGFAPNRGFDLHVYRSEELGGWKYAGTVGGIPTDNTGSATHPLETLPDDPPGTYCLVSEGNGFGLALCSEAEFRLVEP